MASSREFLDYVLERLSFLQDVSCRPMMGEYLLYYRGKLVGGIYDSRLLVKPTETALSLLSDSAFELPYKGAKPMLAVDISVDRKTIEYLFNALYDELPNPKPKKLKN